MYTIKDLYDLDHTLAKDYLHSSPIPGRLSKASRT